MVTIAYYTRPGPISEPQYERVATLTHSLHFDEFDACYRDKQMKSGVITYNKCSEESRVDNVKLTSFLDIILETLIVRETDEIHCKYTFVM